MTKEEEQRNRTQDRPSPPFLAELGTQLGDGRAALRARRHRRNAAAATAFATVVLLGSIVGLNRLPNDAPSEEIAVGDATEQDQTVAPTTTGSETPAVASVADYLGSTNSQISELRDRGRSDTVASCMQSRGFEYWPEYRAAEENQLFISQVADAQYRLAQAKEHGWRLTDAFPFPLGATNEPSTSPDDESKARNQNYVEALDPTSQAAYNLELHGLTAQGVTPEAQERSCIQAGWDYELVDDYASYPHEEIASLETRLQVAREALYRSDLLVNAQDQNRACITSLGLGGSTPEEFRELLADEVQSFVHEFPVPENKTLSELNSLAESDPWWDVDRLSELRQREFDVAIHIAQCELNHFAPAADQEATKMEQEFVQDHEGELLAIAKRLEEWSRGIDGVQFDSPTG